MREKKKKERKHPEIENILYFRVNFFQIIKIYQFYFFFLSKNLNVRVCKSIEIIILNKNVLHFMQQRTLAH